MKFILKDKHIFVVENDNIVYNNIEGDIILDNVFSAPENRIQFSVNGGLFKDIENNRISIDKGELKDPHFELKVRVLHKEGVELFTSDKIPLTQAIILGQPMEDKYPEIIRSLIEATRRLEAQQEDIIKVLNYLDTKGDVL
jgi:hypothetical protein